MNEKKTINDEELDSVAGGNRQNVSVNAGNRVTVNAGNQNSVGVTQGFGCDAGKGSISQNKSISRNKRLLGQCEPEENLLKQFVCSDPTNRGKKPECANCRVGIK